MLKDFFIALVSTFCFAIVFNIRGKNIIFASFGGVVSWLTYKIALHHGFDVVQASFISAVIFSIYSEMFARILKTPVTSIVICGLIPLVPGSGMYYTMYAAVKGNANQTLNLTLNTLACAGSLALGVILVSTITRLVFSAKRKVVKNPIIAQGKKLVSKTKGIKKNPPKK